MFGTGARNHTCLAMLASAAIIGCADVAEQPLPKTDSRADEVIAEAMRETAKANRIAAELEKRFAGLSSISRGRIERKAAGDDGKRPAPFALRWNGPVEPLARSLAELSGIKLRIFGTPPAHPALVSVHAENVDLNDAIELVDTASFGFAELRMDSVAGVLELRYPLHE